MPEGASAEARGYRTALASIEVELRCLALLEQSTEGEADCEAATCVLAILADRLALSIAALSLDAVGPFAVPDQRSLGHNQRIGAFEAGGAAAEFSAAVANLARSEFANYAVLVDRLLGEPPDGQRETESDFRMAENRRRFSLCRSSC